MSWASDLGLSLGRAERVEARLAESLSAREKAQRSVAGKASAAKRRVKGGFEVHAAMFGKGGEIRNVRRAFDSHEARRKFLDDADAKGHLHQVLAFRDPEGDETGPDVPLFSRRKGSGQPASVRDPSTLNPRNFYRG